MTAADASEELHRMMGDVHDEAYAAQGKYGDFASMHEAFGVLTEEYHELLEAVRLRQSDPTRCERIRKEALQVSAVAMRMAAQTGRVTR